MIFLLCMKYFNHRFQTTGTRICLSIGYLGTWLYDNWNAYGKSKYWKVNQTANYFLFQLPWANAVRPHEERIYIQNQLLAKKGPPIPDELKKQHETYDFIQLCLTPNVNERPLAKTLLDHPYPRVRTGTKYLLSNHFYFL